MRKFTSFLLLLFMAMVVKAQTEAVTTTYDFEDGNAMFVGRSRITVGVEDALGYDGTKAVHFTCAHNAQNGYSFANFDISSLVGDPKIVDISLQYYNTNGGRAILSIGDASVRGTTGNSSKSTYSNRGAIFALGSDKNNALINGSKKTLSTYCDKWLNVNVTVNVTEKTYSYSISESETGTELASGEDVAYYNSEALACTQIDLFGYINNNKCAYIDNLTITVTPDERQYADYTVRYVDEAGNVLKEDATYNSAVGDAITLTGSDKESFLNSDNTKKYIYQSDDAADKTIASDGSTVVTVTFREAETWSYTANAVDGEGNVLEVLGSWSYFEGETVKVPYSRYILQDGILYEKGANSSEYRSSLTLSADNQVLDIVYSTSSTTNAIYFSEAEDIEGVTKYEDGYTQIRMSEGAAGYATTDLTTITTLPAGVYTLTSATRQGDIKFYAASDSVFAIASGGSYTTTTSDEFTFYEDTEIKVSAGSKSNYFDYLLICRTGDAPIRELVIDDTDAEGKTEYPDFAPEYSSYSSVVYNRELNTGYTYGLICLPFAPDAESLKNFQFYALSSASGDAITFEEVDAPEAARPYLYSIKEGATRTNCITGGATTFDLNDPTAVNNFAAGTWELVGSLENASIDCTDQTTTLNYAFNPAASTLHKVTKTLTVYPYTAYVRNNIATSAATMRVYISGPTGIKEISRDAIEGFDATEGMFDLQGRAMSKPMKGQIYIQNGVKKIKR